MRKVIIENWRIVALGALGSVSIAGSAAASIMTIPEPSMFAIFATGVVALIVLQRRRK